MDKELKQLQERLEAINLIISKLDPAIKLAAFDLLKPFIMGEVIPPALSLDTEQVGEKIGLSTGGDVRDFYASFDPKKPADSVLVLAAWIYTQRGSASFTLTELNDLFDDVGVSRPARLDMTLRTCTRNGKNLFQNASHGSYRPTVHGENHFKKEMNLRPGKHS